MADTTVQITLARRDASRLAGSLESRAEWLERRREGDTSVRRFHLAEAAHSRRLAALVREAAQ